MGPGQPGNLATRVKEAEDVAWHVPRMYKAWAQSPIVKKRERERGRREEGEEVKEEEEEERKRRRKRKSTLLILLS